MATSHYQTGVIRTHRTRNLGSRVQLSVDNPVKLQRFSRLIDSLPRAVQRTMKRAQMNFAKRLKKQVKRNIYNRGQGLGWDPVSSSYASFKRKHGTVKDPNKFYQLYGNYIRAITIKTQGNTVSIGISKDSSFTNRAGTLTTAQYAVILESGSLTRNIAPRPLWGPSYQQLGGNKGLRAEMVKALGTELATKYGLY